MDRPALHQLADHLLSVPQDTFSMENIMVRRCLGPKHYGFLNDASPCDYEYLHRCVANPLGHSTILFPEIASRNVFWSEYTPEAFNITSGTHVYEFLFSEDWLDVDNTPTGAAARIRRVLRDGLPQVPIEDWISCDHYNTEE